MSMVGLFVGSAALNGSITSAKTVEGMLVADFFAGLIGVAIVVSYLHILIRQTDLMGLQAAQQPVTLDKLSRYRSIGCHVVKYLLDIKRIPDAGLSEGSSLTTDYWTVLLVFAFLVLNGLYGLSLLLGAWSHPLLVFVVGGVVIVKAKSIS